MALIIGKFHVGDRIILTFHGDPATSRAVTWRTNNQVDKVALNCISK